MPFGLSVPMNTVAARRRAIREWQARIRDPSLTVLLVLDCCAVFIAQPLAARGLPIAQTIAEMLVLAVLLIVVLLSQRRGAIFLILTAVAAIAASLLFGSEWPPIARIAVRHGGDIVAFSVLIWVVVHAVYAPGRITFRRLQGAVVVYLSIGTIFASLYGLIWELKPVAFANLHPSSDSSEIATMLYFSLTTLTTVGYGDIVPVDPFARSLSNLEAIIGQLYLAITVARLVTLELADRRDRDPFDAPKAETRVSLTEADAPPRD
jgi:Ion channel